MEMNKENFVTCDLLDANPESQVCLPNIEGKVFRHFGAKDKFCGEIVTVKCFEDNSRVKSLLNSDGKDKAGDGKVLVVDGGGSMRCALLGDMIAQSAIDNGWAGWHLVASRANQLAVMKVKRISKSALVI